MNKLIALMAFVMVSTASAQPGNSGDSQGLAGRVAQLEAQVELLLSLVHENPDPDGILESFSKSGSSIFLDDADLVGVGLDLLDSGTTYEGFLQAALDAVFGQNPSGATLVNHFYGTLTGQSAPQSLIEQYGSLIDNGSLSPVSLAMQVAENELNLQNIDLIGLATTGIEYT